MAATTAAKSDPRPRKCEELGSAELLCYKAGPIFKQSIPGLSLSIEESTENVPADGRYYVIDRGVIHRSYRTLRQATAVYDQLRAERTTDTATDADGSRTATL